MAKRNEPFLPKSKEEKLAFIAQLDGAEAKKYEGKRNSFKRSFENIYLRSNILRRAMTELPRSKIDSIVSDREFQDMTRYVAMRVFNRYRDFLLVYGFEAEDLISMARLFGVNFFISKYEAKTKKDENYLMLRYIGQRFHRFIDWSIKKFGTAMPVRPRAEAIGEDDDENASLYDEVSYRDWTSTSNLNTDEINGIMVYMEDQSPLADLRKKLDSDWEKHSESLAHYATTTYTSQEVRRKARSFCRKYGIDYVKWAKAKIELGKMNDHDVDLR